MKTEQTTATRALATTEIVSVDKEWSVKNNVNKSTKATHTHKKHSPQKEYEYEVTELKKTRFQFILINCCNSRNKTIATDFVFIMFVVYLSPKKKTEANDTNTTTGFVFHCEKGKQT